MAKLEILSPHPALKLTTKKEIYLIVSDLHIGFEHRFNKEGFNIKPSITKMLQTLTELIYLYKPDKLLILGDIKSGFSRINKEERRHVPKLMEQVAEHIEISIIPGNHDGLLKYLLPKEVKLELRESLIDDTGFLHGHTVPSKKLAEAKRLVMGHIHPSYSRKGSPLSGRPVWLTLKVKKKLIFKEYEGKDDMIEVWVMPTFNTELSTGGLRVFRKKIISPLFRKISGTVSEALIITLDGSVIGDTDSMKYVLQ
jgi:hypothetical protein|tara:strand:- start:916 stop:1677 length:762 start_codon:yes stop_codon:yes gene_type:complete